MEQYINYEKIFKEELIKENQKLKELLIRAGDYLPEWITPMDILAEIDRLKEES